jgi:hypothetical protein
VAEADVAAQPQSPQVTPSPNAVLRQRWFAGEFDVQSKKELLRCVIDQVRLTTGGKVVCAEVVWQGGTRSELDVPKYIGPSTEAYHRVFELAKTHTDAEIADELNTQGFLTMKQKPWSARRVMDFRASNAIPSGLPASATMRLPETDYIRSSKAAERLGVDEEPDSDSVPLGRAERKAGCGAAAALDHVER